MDPVSVLDFIRLSEDVQVQKKNFSRSGIFVVRSDLKVQYIDTTTKVCICCATIFTALLTLQGKKKNK